MGVLSFSFTKLSSLPSLQNGPPLCCFSVAWPLCFLSLFPVPLFWFSSPLSPFQKLFPLLSKNSPPSFSFPALSPFFKNSSPLPFAAASKGSGAATCAWGAGDTKPGQPALLPRLRCSPLLRVSGSGMHMGGTLYTLFWFFSFFFLFIFFIFVGIQK